MTERQVPAKESLPTHDVLNQPPVFGGANLFASDAPLVEAVKREGAEWAVEQLTADGELYGRPEIAELGELANRHTPELMLFDRYGRRLDEVRFHPAWHELMSIGAQRGYHTGPWADPRPGAHVRRAAGYVLHAQVEAGTECPLTMTYGSIPALRRNPELAKTWLPVLFRQEYDPTLGPIEHKRGGLVGMGMTEKQGGSDVRSNSTVATPTGDPGVYALRGHKWFLSAPMCDAFMVLAQMPGGLTCFFVPRVLPDGTRNSLHLQRLKDKLGNRSNASAEVELFDALAWQVGDVGRGVPTIIEMTTYTRLDCVVGSAGMMRAAVTQAMHHAAHRTAFGKRLLDAPLMRTVLADMALEAEGAIALGLRLARAFDHQEEPGEVAVRRILTPASKFFVCKRAPALAAEAMEVLGGIGYVEESPLARLYRETPVNSIWEGSGNVMCLDVIRAAAKAPESVEALMAELREARGGHAGYDAFVAELEAGWTRSAQEIEAGARHLVQSLALAAQASILIRHAPTAIADAFCESRLRPGHGHVFGTFSFGDRTAAILERARIA